jgi:hypothetical protein
MSSYKNDFSVHGSASKNRIQTTYESLVCDFGCRIFTKVVIRDFIDVPEHSKLDPYFFSIAI